MKEPTQRERIRKYLQENPGQEAATIAKDLGIANVASLRSDLYNMSKPGGSCQLLKFKVRTSVTGTSVYGFRINPDWVPYERKEKASVKDFTPATQALSSLDTLVESLAMQLADAIAGALVPKLVGALRPRIEEGLAKALPALAAPSEAVPAHDPRPVQEERPERRAVCVVGLMNDQSKIVKKHFDGRFAFAFPDRNNTRGIKAVAKNCDSVYLMTGFVSHSTHNALKQCVSANRLHFVNGGVTELTRMLEGEGK